MTGRDADDSARLTRWVTEHGRAVLGYLIASTRNRDASDDLLQETFARAWQARSRYADSGSERSYLIRIADRLVHDRYRRAKSRPQVQLDDEDWARADPPDERATETIDLLARQDASRKLAEAMDVLSDPQRRTLLMRFHGEMNFDDIAVALELPVNTVLSHCHRGLKALRRHLSEKTV